MTDLEYYRELEENLTPEKEQEMMDQIVSNFGDIITFIPEELRDLSISFKITGMGVHHITYHEGNATNKETFCHETFTSQFIVFIKLICADLS